jgi:hypothetical protein
LYELQRHKMSKKLNKNNIYFISPKYVLLELCEYSLFQSNWKHQKGVTDGYMNTIVLWHAARKPE